jgi:hypothetical protein
LRRPGRRAAGRSAAPFLALTPLVIWIVVSTDAVILAVTAWGIALLAVASTTLAPRRRLLLSLAAGLVLGVGLFWSYGMVLMGPLAVAVLLAARTWRPLVPAALAALGVAAAFAAAGFWWLEGMRLLEVRYYQGKGGVRQYSYWVWADLVVAAVAVGPAVVAALGRTASRVGRWREAPPAVLLATGAVVAILAATLSGPVEVGGREDLAAVHALAGAARRVAAGRAVAPVAGGVGRVGAAGRRPLPHDLVTLLRRIDRWSAGCV